MEQARSGHGRSPPARFLLVGVLLLAVAGAVAGVVLGTGHGVVWAAVGAGVAAVTMLVATFWWEAARERRSQDGKPRIIQSLRIRQRIGAIGRRGEVVGARSASSAGKVDVRQRIDTAGPDSTVTGYEGDPGQTT